MPNTSLLCVLENSMRDYLQELKWVKAAMLLSINDSSEFKEIVQRSPGIVSSILNNNRKLREVFEKNRTAKQILQKEGLLC